MMSSVIPSARYSCSPVAADVGKRQDHDGWPFPQVRLAAAAKPPSKARTTTCTVPTNR